MIDQIAFVYNPYTYFESYKNVLNNLRKYYPNADVFIYFDPHREDTENYRNVANEYNCIFDVTDNEMSYINRNDSVETNEPKLTEWLRRLKHTCENTKANWILHLEDDVLIKREIRNWPSADVGTCREYFRPGGGAIFKREVFLDSIKKVDVSKYIRTIPDACWAGDLLLENIFRNNGVTYERWTELAEPNYYEDTDHAVFHGYKELHKLG